MSAQNSETYLNDCLKRRLILFTGKGGVGKSAIAWGTALALHHQNRRVRFASWSPFDSEAKPARVAEFGIHWEHLDTLTAFKEYALRALKFDKIYDAVFENKVLRTFLQAAPGLSETVIAGKVWDLYQKDEQDILVVDLPSTGHALSFFQSPMGVEKIFKFGFVHREAHKICEMFLDAATRIDIVTLPEEMPMVESREFQEKLLSVAPFHMGFLVVNQCTPQFKIPSPLPVLPDALASFIKSYEIRKTKENEAILQEARFNIPAFEVPKFATEGFLESIESVARFIEFHGTLPETAKGSAP